MLKRSTTTMLSWEPQSPTMIRSYTILDIALSGNNDKQSRSRFFEVQRVEKRNDEHALELMKAYVVLDELMALYLHIELMMNTIKLCFEEKRPAQSKRCQVVQSKQE